MKGYQKLTLITAILGLVVLVPIIVGYVYFNSLIGFPILGLFLGGILLHVFVLLLVNAANLYVAFRNLIQRNIVCDLGSGTIYNLPP